MKIEINNLTKLKINLQLMKKVARLFFREHEIGDQELSLAIVGDAAIKKLNQKYRGINKPTDVLSFAGEGEMLGEIVLDWAQIKRQAKQSGLTAERELAFILTHGLLHLIGYDDKTEAERVKMIKLGERFIEKLKL